MHHQCIQAPAAPQAVKSVEDATDKAATPKNNDELKAYLDDKAVEDPVAEKSVLKSEGESDKWADCMMGLANKAVMTFTGLGRGPVADAYQAPLGITWADTVVRRMWRRRGNPPTPREVARFTGNPETEGVDGSFTSTDGLIKQVSFYYATPSIVLSLIDLFPKSVFTKATVTAWTGPTATGKKLETMELPWTYGDLRFNFTMTDFEFKGVAKSISFTVPKWDDTKFFGALYLDNVEITEPAGKAKILAAGALEVEEKAVEIENELKALLNVTHKI